MPTHPTRCRCPADAEALRYRRGCAGSRGAPFCHTDCTTLGTVNLDTLSLCYKADTSHLPAYVCVCSSAPTAH